MEEIILVDENDNQIGTGEKMKVHEEGKLHRCFSIFVFNSKGELMLQKRASTKYHCGGLWTNTCCGHPRPGEGTEEAAHRRLKEEMNFDCELEEALKFIYKAVLDHGLTEHEYDHVFIGDFDGKPVMNPEEAEDWKWISLDDLRKDIEKNPASYTYWSKIALEKLIPCLK